jgi:hypothetical protein
MTNKITWYVLYRHKMKFTCSDFENWLMIILIDCHYTCIKVFLHFPWYYNLHTDTYLISELQYPFIGVLECKFNLDGSLQVNYELTIMRIKHGFPLQLEKVDLVITDTPAFQIFIHKPLKSLSSKKKRAIIHERYMSISP